MEKLFAVCAPGLEAFTQLELRELGLIPSQQPATSLEQQSMIGKPGADAGGVEFVGELREIYLSNLYLRTASRIIIRLGDFYAAAFSELRKKASRLAWERFLKPGQAVALSVTCHRSRLYHSDAVAERVIGAIGDRLGQPPKASYLDQDKTIPITRGELPRQLILVRIFRDHCMISIDSSGELLHRRGYRLATAKAPLRETLAAGMLMASGWDQMSPLIDPFCGSGSIPIEAALMALGIAPGCSRRFAFMDWENFDGELWESLVKENIQQVEAKKATGADRLKIIGSDRDAGAIQMALSNAKRCGVENSIEFFCQAVSAMESPGKGWVVMNPPYGLRVSAKDDLRNLYAQFGKVLCIKFIGWRVAILCNNFQLLRNTGLRLDTSLRFVNGGVPVRLARGIVGG